MFLKKNFLWLLLFGTMVGLNETLIGGIHFPFRSVMVSSLTISLLSFARVKIPKAGTSAVITLIAIVFKMNNFGFLACTAHSFLISVFAILSLGISYEVIGTLIFRKESSAYLKHLLTCALSVLTAFTLFGMMNTFVFGSWGTDRLVNFLFINTPLAALISGAITVTGLHLSKMLKSLNFKKLNPSVVNSILGILIIGLWVLGTWTKL